eukprot:ANDGO_01972.mRNA.1 putative inactive protein kinase DDB_G0270444
MGNASSNSVEGTTLRTYNFKTEGPVFFSALIPDRNQLVALGSTFLESFRAQEVDRKWLAYVEAVTCADIDAARTREIYCGCADGKVRVYETEIGGKLVRSLIPSSSVGSNAEAVSEPPAITCVKSISEDIMLFGDALGTVYVYNLKKREVESSFGIDLKRASSGLAQQAPVPAAILCLAQDAKRNHTWCGFSDGVIRCYDQQGKRVLQLGSANAAKMAEVRAIEIIAQHDICIFAVANKSLHVWDLSSGKELVSYQFDVLRMYYCPQTDLLFTGGDDGKLVLWRLPRERSPSPLVLLKKFDMHTRPLWCITYYSGVDALLTGGFDCVVKLLPRTFSAMLKDYAAAQVIRMKQEQKEEQARQVGIDLQTVSEEEEVVLLDELYGRSAPPMPAVVEEAKMKALYLRFLKALDNGTPEGAGLISILTAGFHDMLDSLKKELATASSNLGAAREQIYQRHRPYLEPTFGVAQIENTYAEKLEEMKRRHEQELRDLKAFYEEEQKRFEDAIGNGKHHAALDYHKAKYAYAARNRELEAATISQMRGLLLSSVPHSRQFSEKIKLICAINPRTQKVYHAMDIDSLVDYAVKVLPPKVPLNLSLKHRSLVSIIDVAKTEKATYVVMEMMIDNLRHKLATQDPDIIFPPSEIAALVYDVADALNYLHENAMVLRDLRPENVLLDKEGNSKVVHIGLMKSLTGSESNEEGFVYAAPELFARMILTASDMWSLGCIIMQLFQTSEERKTPIITGEHAQEVFHSISKFVDIPDTAALAAIAAENRLSEGNTALYCSLPLHRTLRLVPLHELVPHAPVEALDLISRLLVVNPKLRITAAEVLRHPFIHKYVPRVAGREPLQPELPIVYVLPKADPTGGTHVPPAAATTTVSDATDDAPHDVHSDIPGTAPTPADEEDEVEKLLQSSRELKLVPEESDEHQ